jgi:hypothetical protein
MRKVGSEQRSVSEIEDWTCGGNGAENGDMNGEERETLENLVKGH